MCDYGEPLSLEPGVDELTLIGATLESLNAIGIQLTSRDAQVLAAYYTERGLQEQECAYLPTLFPYTEN